MASGLLPKSPVSSSLCDEAPHIFIPKSHLEPREFLISSAKRLLQHNLPISDIASLIRTTKEVANRSAPLGQFVSQIFADPTMRKIIRPRTPE
jgi:hypothetical protein